MSWNLKIVENHLVQHSQLSQHLAYNLIRLIQGDDRFSPLSGRTPYATGQLSPHAATTAACALQQEKPPNEKPMHHNYAQTHVHCVSDAIIQLFHPLSFPSPPALNLS